MPINSKRVTGRRTLRYATLDEFLADAERLAGSGVTMLGNWSLGQVFRHLAIAINGSIDGFSFRLPALMIWCARLVVKKQLLMQGIKPGFGFFGWGGSVMPGKTSVADSLAELRAAVARFAKETKRSPHPALGPLSDDEWYQFHLRHAELHMSFARPMTSL